MASIPEPPRCDTRASTEGTCAPRSSCIIHIMSLRDFLLPILEQYTRCTPRPLLWSSTEKRCPSQRVNPNMIGDRSPSALGRKAVSRRIPLILRHAFDVQSSVRTFSPSYGHATACPSFDRLTHACILVGHPSITQALGFCRRLDSIR